MKCLILAAGYATRLYPLTKNFPKALLEVKGKTILDWLVDDIDTANVINEYIVVSNHNYVKHFEDWSQTKKQKIVIVDDGTTDNESRLGAVKDIQFVIDKLKIDDDLLVVAGDNVLDFSLSTFIKYAIEKKTACIMRYYEPDDRKLLSCGVVSFGAGDEVIDMTEKSLTPKTHWCCPPFYYFTKESIKLVKKGIESGCNTDAPGGYISWLCGQTSVYAMCMPGKRYDIGNMESYEKVKAEYEGIKI